MATDHDPATFDYEKDRPALSDNEKGDLIEAGLSKLDHHIEAMERELKSARRETALTLADGFERHACGPSGVVARPGVVVIRAEAYLAFLNGDVS